MKRLAGFWTGRIAPIASRVADAAADYATSRAALTALALLLLAFSGIGRMETAYKQSVVKEGRYSLAETPLRPWRAPDLRVGWKKKDAYVATADHIVLATLSVARFSSLLCLLLTPAAWLAGQWRRQSTRGGAPAFSARPAAPPSPMAEA